MNFLQHLSLYGGIALLTACSGTKSKDLVTDLPISVEIDLINVTQDKVSVTVDPGRFTQDTITFNIPKTVPGTYSNNDYGQFLEDFRALDYQGKELTVTRKDVNSWLITNATALDKVSYLVNDSFDTEIETDKPVFSPAGSNIEAGKNFFLNLHMFVGYFTGLQERPYLLQFDKPQNLEASTGLTRVIPSKPDPNRETLMASRYFEVTDNPVMFTPPSTEVFQLKDIEVHLTVYSPNGVHSAASFKEDMMKMMEAQKRFLGDLNTTKKYSILLYLSTMEADAPQGLGALEHHSSTTVVLPEVYPREELIKTMIDVVSHEFFHIITPLNVHSREVHYFDYNHPKMSRHLWMYEGVTEYFSHLFQVKQGLINEEEFLKRMASKIEGSRNYNDSIAFTELSQKILEDNYKDEYYNVYEKGALIGMCMDIIIREQSQGEKGILWLMKELSARYGADRPFNDEALFDEIGKLSSPALASFINLHVNGATPIDYNQFLNKTGLQLVSEEEPSGFFFKEEEPFIDANPATGEIFIREIPLNSMMVSLGLQSGDIIKKVNGEAYKLDNARDLIIASYGWQENEPIEIVVSRGDEEVTLSGKVSIPTIQSLKIRELPGSNSAQLQLKESWLKS